jgi:hypothetical protein
MSSPRLRELEPVTKLGLRTYELYLWELREGPIKVQLDRSQSTLATRGPRDRPYSSPLPEATMRAAVGWASTSHRSPP